MEEGDWQEDNELGGKEYESEEKSIEKIDIREMEERVEEEVSNQTFQAARGRSRSNSLGEVAKSTEKNIEDIQFSSKVEHSDGEDDNNEDGDVFYGVEPKSTTTTTTILKSEKVYFSDWKVMSSLVTQLCSSQEEEWESVWNEKWEWMMMTLLVFQEQPTLLNPYLESFVNQITTRLLQIMENNGFMNHNPMVNSNSDTTNVQWPSFQRFNSPQFHALCKFIQLLCRIRGYKNVSKFFPHEVVHIEPCINLLASQDKLDYSNWETRFVLLIWLSILVLVPFDICSIDSSLRAVTQTDDDPRLKGMEKHSKLITDIVNVCKIHLSESGPTREAAASCLSVLLTRPDMEAGVLHDFIEWSGIKINEILHAQEENSSVNTSSNFLLIGILHSLTRIFKLGERSILLPLADQAVDECLTLFKGPEQSTLVRKLMVKLLQRVALVFLPPKVASWRYQVGSRSLLGNLQPGVNSTFQHESEVPDEDTEGLALPEKFEEVVENLFKSLQDKDTVVRWSSAKGIGRITMRLPKELGCDIISALIAIFSEEDSESSWHGGCLAIAELARRGLLLPEHLEEVVPIVSKAIQFDILRGQHSVGAHVRDSACYVCWSFARAYAPLVLSAFIQPLSDSMIVTSLFDREIHCRRAASAAFQENVGRQGNENFPNGLEILTLADYFSLGNRANAYLNVAPSVAELSPRLLALLMEHLRTFKICHWDADIRSLAAKSLGKLAKQSFDNAVESLTKLLSQCISSSIHERHGAILAVAEIVENISFHFKTIGDSLAESVSTLVPKLDKARLFRGRGGELLRVASCNLIECIGKCHLIIPLKTQVHLVEILNENLRQPHESIQLAASSALRQMLFSYFPVDKEPSERLQNLTVLKYLNGIKSSEENVAAIRGYALALGSLPPKLIKSPDHRILDIINALEVASDPRTLYNNEPDAEVRRNAVSSLSELIEKLTSYHQNVDHCVNFHAIVKAVHVLIKATEDYSIDKRGDTGSWCRIAAMNGLERIIYAIARGASSNYPCDQESRYTLIDRSQKSQICQGSHVWTCYGHGIVEQINELSESVIISYPLVSIGQEKTNGFFCQCKQADVKVTGSSPAPLLYQKFVFPDANERVRHPLPPNKSNQVDSDNIDELINEQHMKLFVDILLKQLGEKLDSAREIAGTILERLITSTDPFLYNLPDSLVLKHALDSVLKEHSSLVTTNIINWALPKNAFRMLIATMTSPLYFKAIILGMISSVGGLTESTVRESSSYLLEWCRLKKKAKSFRDICFLGDTLLELFEHYSHSPRLSLPIMKTLILLLRNGVFEYFVVTKKYDFSIKLLKNVENELKGCNDIVKLKLGIDLFVLLLHFTNPVRLTAFKNLLLLLGSKYPKVRKYNAEQLYLHLISDQFMVDISTSSATDAKEEKATIPDDEKLCPLAPSREALAKAEELLLSTSWIGELQQCREHRKALCDILKIELNISSAKSKSLSSWSLGGKKKNKANKDELDSYDSLVKEAGY